MQSRSNFDRLKADADAVKRLLSRSSSSVHMLGIGGMGMAGLAVQLAGRGFKVSGCDKELGSLIPWLKEQGIDVERGHSPVHIADDMTWLVRSAAVGEDEPEIQRAHDKGLQVFSRGVVLPALLDGFRSVAVGGTHGKTTTTAMLVHLFKKCGIDPSYCVGGELGAPGGVAEVGKSDVMVVEADESDGTLALYEPDYAVITNIEMDHVDHFRTAASLRSCFQQFARHARQGVVCCADDHIASKLIGKSGRIRTFGLAKSAHVRAIHVRLDAETSRFDVVGDGKKLGQVVLPVSGQHNVLNALAACTVALDMGLTFDRIRAALKTFKPVRRRFERIAEAQGISVISDYAHHPTEIAALVAQARALGKRRILAVFQPHRYSRTAAMGRQFPAAFKGVDRLVLVPVYAASEKPLPGGTAEDLHRHFRRARKVNVDCVQSLLEAWGHIRKIWRKGDVVLVAGAGDVDQIAGWARKELLAGK